MAEVFRATIGVVDEATEPLRRIAARVGAIGARMRSATRHIVRGEAAAEARERLAHIGHAFEAVESSVNGVIGAVAKFVPAFGALGAGGSLAGLVALTKGVADSRAEAVRTAEKIGILPEQFKAFRGAAKLAGVDSDVLAGGLTKLNKAVALATSGKSKDLAALFQHIGISSAQLKTMNVADLLPRLAEAFSRTTNSAVKTRAAMLLFGKSGAELIPMLNKGAAGLAEAQRAFAGLGYKFTAADDENLRALRVSWMRVDVAISGVKNAIGARLAPVLQPIIDRMATWIGANREWIATNIAGKVEELSRVMGELWEVIRRIDWQRPTGGLLELGRKMWDIAGNVEGLHLAIGGLALLLASPLITAVASAVSAIGTIAVAIRGIGALMLTNPFGWILTAVALVAVGAYELYEHWSGVKAFFRDLWDGVTAAFHSAWQRIAPIVQRISGAVGWISGHLGFGGGASVPALPAPGGPTLSGTALPGPRLVAAPGAAGGPLAAGGAGAAAPGGQRDGAVEVKVTFDNLPPGARVEAASSGIARDPDLDLGYSMAGMQ